MKSTNCMVLLGVQKHPLSKLQRSARFTPWLNTPVRLNSCHMKPFNTKLNETMKTISGCLEETLLPWLRVVSNIARTTIRIQECLVREHNKIILNSLTQWPSRCRLAKTEITSRTNCGKEFQFNCKMERKLGSLDTSPSSLCNWSYSIPTRNGAASLWVENTEQDKNVPRHLPSSVL